MQHVILTPNGPAAAPVVHETDDQIIERLRDRFTILEELTVACKNGDIRAMIVSGPPGVGKSYGIETVLRRDDIMATIANDDSLMKYDIIKGNISPIMVYKKLWEHRRDNHCVVFDDADSALMDATSLNILKAALDSGQRRIIGWHTDSRLLKEEQIPNSFEFEGSCIFITNLNFATVRSQKLKDQLDALESRCHYLDLTINTDREKMLRIKQLAYDGLLSRYKFSEEEVHELMDFMTEHQTRMRELSLRMVLKVADLKKSMPRSWKDVSRMTCMKPAHRR